MSEPYDGHSAEALRFIEARPEVFAMFCDLAWDRIKRGHTRYSADAIFHRMRWDNPRLALNDHWTATFAREWTRRHRDYAGFFELRASEADGAPSLQCEMFA